MSKLIVETKTGTVQGAEKPQCLAFLGIPYAKAGRFERPQPYSWKGVLPCTAYGSKSIATNFFRNIPAGVEYPIFGSEDCLNLNIWAPKDIVEGEKLPVVFYVHGGGYQIGSNSSWGESGEGFLQGAPRLIFVSVNYRLGIQGFLEWGEILGPKYEGSSNNGIRDVIAGLKWTHDNISRFGGDPNRITLMGLSAGSKTVACLTICPESRGLFSQIICESGAVQSIRHISTARKLTKRFVKLLGTEDPEVILNMDPYKLLDAQIRMADTQGSVLYYGPVFDDELFPEDWKEHFAWKGHAMMGCCRNELFAAFKGPFLSCADDTLDGLFGIYSDYARAEVKKILGDGEASDADKYKALVKVASDFMYRTYNDRFSTFLSEHDSKVWNYCVEFHTATHTYGFNLVMKNFAPPPMRMTLKPEDMPNAMTVHEHMKSRYVNFITTGTPNSDGRLFWPEWTAKLHRKYQFNVEDSVMENADGDTITTFPEYMYEL